MPYNRLNKRQEEDNTMATKTIYNLKGLDYNFDNTRKGAKYEWFDTIANEYKRGNTGDFFEIADKFVKGYEPHKDGNGKYNEGSDIEETHTSCKSWEFTLAPIKEETFEKVLEIYWNNVASTNFDFGWKEEEELIIYNMNSDEFNQFLYRFARYEKNRKVIRGPKPTNKNRIKIEKWFEART